tara:strand:+ start:270 stop:836 length:567 start_codon:yes stop_codon:yes gene_type:complete
MSTVYLLPNSVDSSGSDWTNVGGTSADNSLTDDDADNYIKATSDGLHNTFGLDDFKPAHFLITNVTHVFKAREVIRSGRYTITVAMINAAGSTLYSQSHTENATADYNSEVGTTRTTSNGSSAWTKTDLAGLQLKITATDTSGDLRITYAALRVLYEETRADICGLDHDDVGNIIGKDHAAVDKVSGR